MKKKSMFVDLSTEKEKRHWHLKIADWINSQERRKIHQFFRRKQISEEQRTLLSKKGVVLFYLEDKFDNEHANDILVCVNQENYFCIH